MKGGFKKRIDMTPEVIIDALRDSMGNVSKAARELEIHPMTLYRAMKRVPGIAEELRRIREARVDHVENCLMDQIEAGNVTATIFFLKCQGRHRGWIDRREHQHNVNARQVNITVSPEQLEQMDSLSLANTYRALGSTGEPARIESMPDTLLLEEEDEGTFAVQAQEETDE